MFLRWLALGVLMVLPLCEPVAAGGTGFAEVPGDQGSLTLYVDNDRSLNIDSDYTSGIRLSWVSPELKHGAWSMFDQALGYLAGAQGRETWLGRLKGYGRGNALLRQRSFSFTHLMYTPFDEQATRPPPGQHPYAGWLGLGFGASVSGERSVSSADLMLGVIGPAAGGQEVQDTFHSIRNTTRFSGWDSQVPNEVTLNLYLNTKRKISWASRGRREGWGTDTIWHSGLAIGNFKTQATLGSMMRLGWNLPDEVRDMRLSESAQRQAGFLSTAVQADGLSAYAFLGVELRGVLHDAVLDGPLFSDFDTGVSKEPVIGDLYVGFALSYHGIDFGISHTFQSDRYKSQLKNDDYSSFYVSVRY
ncbi:lipid A deacylase LpxR family protein [Rubritalea marina]|uniref:lipid A deacylase LpxR family protein n=1 Tax=Rubritalea marina TaxID=361055 RepID=UPI00038038DC|nr:lipid A deacylase LpxR family protein [Rubritalea marina]